MDIFGMIRGLADAVAAVMGYTRDRQALKNAADVKAAKIAQEEVEAKNKVEEAIRKRDIEALRKELAE